MMYVPHASFRGTLGASYVICQDLTHIPPVSVESVDKFIGGFDKATSDPTLTHKVHYGKKQKRLVRCTVECGARPVDFFICMKFSKSFDIIFYHCRHEKVGNQISARSI